MADETPGAPSALRSVLLYVALVGTPLLGLAAILHAGQRLQAPPSVGGSYTIESVDGGAGACAALARGARVEVSQSGLYLSLTAGAEATTVVVPARLEDGVLRGSVTSASACPALDGAALEATVDRTTSPHRLTARFAGGDGGALALVAARLPAETRRAGKGH